MNSQPPSRRQIVECCIVHNSDEAWFAFFAAYGDLIQGVFLAGARAHQGDWDDFRSWFPGWLFCKRKLESANRALLQKIASGECLTDQAQDDYLCNYIAGIVRSSIAEFFQDRAPLQTTRDPQLLAQIEAHHPPAADDDLDVRVRAALAQLPADQRVPLILKEYDALGPLSDADLQWLANKAGLTPAQVLQAIEPQVQRNRGRRFSLSSAFVGCLLRIESSPDGRCLTIDQRVRRARLRVRALLAKNAETDEP
jgi:hypothetical protein